MKKRLNPLHCPLHAQQIVTKQLVIHVKQCFRVNFWNDHRMPLRVRMNIKKRKRVIVFVDDVARYFFIGDFAKEAGHSLRITDNPDGSRLARIHDIL